MTLDVVATVAGGIVQSASSTNASEDGRYYSTSLADPDRDDARMLSEL